MKAKTFRPSRRGVLKTALCLGGATLLAEALDGAAQQEPKFKATLKKRSKEMVGYRDEPYEGRSCAKCVLYAGHGECVLVEGEVSPNGWCVQWTPATMGRRGRTLAA
jgi:hypothetical protein